MLIRCGTFNACQRDRRVAFRNVFVYLSRCRRRLRRRKHHRQSALRVFMSRVIYCLEKVGISGTLCSGDGKVLPRSFNFNLINVWSVKVRHNAITGKEELGKGVTKVEMRCSKL